MPAPPVQPDFDFHIADIMHVTERKANPNWKYDRLSNPDYYIVACCVDGKAVYAFDRQTLHVAKGDLLFFPPGLIRKAAADPTRPWSFLSVAFRLRFENDRSRESLDRLHHLFRSPRQFRLLPLFNELNRLWTAKRSGYLIRCRSILMEILYEMITERDRLEHGAVHYNAIEKTIDHMLAHYTEHFAIDDLARLSGLSSSHFRLLFKKMTGMTSVQFQHHIRINKAKDLLLSGECNVTEAALAVGFQDIYYFSRLFKKLTGISPSHLNRS